MRGRRVGSRAQIPAALEQLPGDLEGDRGLARACGERQKNAAFSAGDRFQRVVDGVVLVIADCYVPPLS